MQDCFREHPDIYGSELEEDGEEEMDDRPNMDAASAASSASPTSTPSSQTDVTTSPLGENEDVKMAGARAKSKQAQEQHKSEAETEQLVPKAWHDGPASGVEGNKKR